MTLLFGALHSTFSHLVHAPQPFGRIFILAFGLAPASGRMGLVCGSESLGAGRARISFVEGALSPIG